jgi:hypothetical protein
VGQKRPSAISVSGLDERFVRPICRKPTVLEMPLSFIERLETVLLSQQGIVAGLLLVAIVYLACQLATERAARERDRETAKQEAAERTKAVEALAVALAKIEGFLSHWGGPR